MSTTGYAYAQQNMDIRIGKKTWFEYQRNVSRYQKDKKRRQN
ncbi:MAG: hypothetical protein V7K21_05035 [Nostoc sp.]